MKAKIIGNIAFVILLGCNLILSSSLFAQECPREDPYFAQGLKQMEKFEKSLITPYKVKLQKAYDEDSKATRRYWKSVDYINTSAHKEQAISISNIQKVKAYKIIAKDIFDKLFASLKSGDFDKASVFSSYLFRYFIDNEAFESPWREIKKSAKDYNTFIDFYQKERDVLSVYGPTNKDLYHFRNYLVSKTNPYYLNFIKSIVNDLHLFEEKLLKVKRENIEETIQESLAGTVNVISSLDGRSWIFYGATIKGPFNESKNHHEETEITEISAMLAHRPWGYVEIPGFEHIRE